MEKLTEFNKIIYDLANIDVNLEDEDKSLHLLCALPRSVENFKDTMLYGNEGTMTSEEDDSGEGLNVSRWRRENRGNGKSKKFRSKSRSKGSGEKTKYKCFLCHTPGHFKKACPQKKGSDSGSSSVQIVISE